MNIRSPSYFIARASSKCEHCGEFTVVLALALPPGHEMRDPEEDADVWEVVPCSAFLFHIEELPDAVRCRLAVSANVGAGADVGADAGARVGAGAGDGWSNHCPRCGGLLEDQDLFCEPGAAFSPESEAEARRIHLTRVAEPFAALAAGYAPDPSFFDALSRD